MRAVLLSTLELRKYRRGDMARAAVIALVLLPLLYGTVYLVAFWTPYDNLVHVPAAIVNLDVAATSQGQRIDAGKQLTSNLRHSQSLDWAETDADSARQGLSNGTYFYVLEIPENFSSSIASLGSNDPHAGLLTLTSDDANSYLTTLVGESLAADVSGALNQTVIQQFVQTTLDGIIEIRHNLKQAADGSGQLAAGTKQLKTGSNQLASGSQQVAAGNTALAQAADDARGYAQDAQRTSGQVVVKMQALVRKFPDSALAKELLAGAIKVNASVDSTTNSIISATRNVDKLGAGSKQLATGAAQLSQGAKQLNTGAKQLSQGLSSGVTQLPTFDSAQARDISDYASAPTAIRQVQLHNAGAYGAGFAPYFMSMALWVAILVVYTLLNALPRRPFLAARIGAFGAVMTGYLPAVFLVVLQVIVLVTVVRFVLGIAPDPGNLGLLAGFLVIVGATYAAIIQLLNIVFGISGKLLALILLMLQLCSCGGTYPIEMSPPFFQDISPYLPMTYSVTGVRHLLVNGSLGPVAQAAGALLLMLAVVLILTTTWIWTHRRVTIADLKPEVEM